MVLIDDDRGRGAVPFGTGEGGSDDTARGSRTGSGQLDRQPLASFRTTGVEDFTSSASGHACAESMRTFALDVARLKRSFHERPFLV